MSNKYLLEIGVEEIPARLVNTSLNQLKQSAEEILKEERIEFGNIKTFSTPRRLTLIIEDLKDKQKDLKEKNRGPSKKIAFDEEDNPSKALEGFMKGQGITIDDVVVEEHKGEEYVFANIVKEGSEVKSILPNLIPKMIKSINFPKAMKWGGREFRFIRPIRWIVSIFNEEILPFDFENIKISNITRGHRFLGSNNIEIKDIDLYEKLLRENYVIANPEDRLDMIISGAERLVKERGGNLDDDDDLLNEIVNIVEYPTPLIGKIKDEYLELPEEVIITPMKEHQRYLPVFDDKGRLMPYFITVRNGNDEFIENVTKGNERVLGARLEDAKFFYEDDTSKVLEEYVDELHNIVFQEKLGTVHDKVTRVQELAGSLSNHLEVGDETEKNVKRAAYLSKADLVTQLVNEFSELQGVMGREYAEKSGENEIVAQAIEEQYLPRFAGDKLPSTTAGMVLSIADKLDTICGLFAIDIKPTGSQDPFALRRQALAIINMIINKRLNLDLSNMIETSLYIYIDNNGLAFDANKVKSDLIEFFNVRIKNILREEGIRHDIIDSVVGNKIDGIYDMKVRTEEVSKWLETAETEVTLEAFNRISNLTRDIKIVEINEDLFEDVEIELYSEYNEAKEEVEGLVRSNEYIGALKRLGQMEPYITDFFDGVMVMVDDDELKRNRLSLLKEIDDLMLGICDLSKIVM